MGEQGPGYDALKHARERMETAINDYWAILAAADKPPTDWLNVWTVDRVFDSMASGELAPEDAREGMKALLAAAEGAADKDSQPARDVSVHLPGGENLALCGAEIGDICENCMKIDEKILNG